jgi:hypothetical protein
MKTFRYVCALLFAITLGSLAHAQIFYDNTQREAFAGGAGGLDEIADDIPFTGTQHVKSFTFEYGNTNAGPVTATVRFYNVDPSTGFPGALVATIPVKNLIPGSPQFATINLTPEQQFDWTAEPGIYGRSDFIGGFVSFQFTGTLFGQDWSQASGPSFDGYYDVTTQQFLNFNQDIVASFYLQLSTERIATTISTMFVKPNFVKGGNQSVVTVAITTPAPVGGVIVKLHCNEPSVAQLPATVMIPAGAKSIRVPVTTKTVSFEKALVISATAYGETIIGNLFVTP